MLILCPDCLELLAPHAVFVKQGVVVIAQLQVTYDLIFTKHYKGSSNALK